MHACVRYRSLSSIKRHVYTAEQRAAPNLIDLQPLLSLFGLSFSSYLYLNQTLFFLVPLHLSPSIVKNKQLALVFNLIG